MRANFFKLIFAGACLALLVPAVQSCRKKGPPPTEAECIAGLKNFLVLMAGPDEKKRAAAQKRLEMLGKRMAGECVKNRSRKVVLCEGRAKSLAEIRDCRKQK